MPYRIESHMTTLKICGSLLYSALSAMLVVSMNNSYHAVFSDIFFWAAAILGTSLMLLVEKADPKTKERVTWRRVFFSIVACLAIVFIAGTVRASMLEEAEFERNHWFYGIVMFLCAIAPELIRLIIIGSPTAISKGFNRGIERRIDRMVGGDGETTNSENEENHE